MDVKFVIIVLLVELFAFGFNSWHFTSDDLDLYNNYGETPLILNVSGVNYQCFTQMNHCHYHSADLRDLNIFHLIFAAIGIMGYFSFVILLCTRKTTMQITRSKVKLGNVARLTILVVTALNSLLLVVHYIAEARLIEKCSRPSQNVRLENMASYLIINVMEIGYLFFDFTTGQHESDHHHDRKTTADITPTDATPLLLNAAQQQHQSIDHVI